MKGIINLSEAISIALHSMVYIASKNGELVNVKEITNELSGSANHIAKVLQRLARAGLLKAIRGPSGGYALAKEQSGITLLDIYESIEGRVETDSCPLGKQKCAFKWCIFKGKLEKVNRDLVDFLSSNTLAEYSGIL